MKKQLLELRSQYLNFLRFSLDESAAATYTSLEIDTNLSAERGIMMEIHSLEVEFTTGDLLREVAQAASEQIMVQLTREEKAAELTFNDADMIAKLERRISRAATIGTDAGPLWFPSERRAIINFPLPIPYVKPSIFIGVLATHATAGQVRGRIGYTLRDIDREEFLELLVALQ